MKSTSLLAFVFACSLMIVACSPQIISSLSVKTSLDTENVQVGDSFMLEIKVVDSDKIESVRINIPALQESWFFEDISEKKWEWKESIQIDAADSPGTAEITVIVRDAAGEEKTEVSAIVID